MSLPRGERDGRGAMERPIGVARARPAARRPRRRPRDRRRQQGDGRIPTELSRQHQIAQPQRQNLGFRAWRAVQHSRRRRTGARRRRQRIFFALKETRSARRAPRNRGPAAVRADRRPCASFVRRTPPGARRNRATADGCGRRGWWARSRRRWAKDARRRAARKNPRDGAPARRRRSRRARRGAGAARRRTADLANNLIEQSEAGAGEESRLEARVGAGGRLFRRPRPGRKRLFQQWVGRRDTRRGALARAPRGKATAPRRADRRPRFRRRRESAGSNWTMA